MNLIKKFNTYNIEYAILSPDLQHALELYDMNYNVVRGDIGDLGTYNRLRIQNAAMLVATNDDMSNTNISFTVRETDQTIPIITNADSDNSIDILRLAGSTHVFQFMKMLGESLARRTMGMSMGANIIGEFDQLLIAEAPAMRTHLEGKTILESNLRKTTGVTIVGLWERGQFELPTPETRINPTTVLVLAGTVKQLDKYDEVFSTYQAYQDADSSVIILGGGRVGQAAARILDERQISYKIVEKHFRNIKNDSYIQGNAADLDTLNQAGIQKATSVVITTHDDSMNIYLTIYCRKLRSDIQIVSRANLDGNISKLHSAGADLVMSHASMGANTIINLLKPNKIVMIAEGLNIFRLPVNASLVGKSLAESQIRKQTGCSVVAISEENKLNINPEPSIVLKTHFELVLIGTSDSEKVFMDLYK
jgi:Trk K+ transport system NAD-binding subunit